MKAVKWVMGLISRFSKTHAEPPELRPPSSMWWWILPAALLIGAAAWATSVWLLQDVDRLPIDKQISARIEAARTALAAAAGVGAAVTLMLAVRRQRHQELATAHTTHDAAERRTTELYTKAADQLGSDQAPVRLAGLYALERLGEHTPALRQRVVDVICAYLRMPFAPPPDGSGRVEPAVPRAAVGGVSAPASRDPQEERQVRLAAQRILADHLRHEEPPVRHWWQPRAVLDTRHWSGIRLDLTGATLMDFDLRHCRVGEASFVGATFTGDARFVKATIIGDAEFDQATFTRSAEFGGVTFTGDARFGRVTFTSAADFIGAIFTRHAEFGGVTFTGDAVFSGATFSGDAEFDEVIFSGYAGFGGAAFAGEARFRRVNFTGNARFAGATFTRDARFAGATFSGYAWFGRTIFTRYVGFDGATGLERAELDGARAAPAPDVHREWPPCWRAMDGTDGWQTLRLAVPGAEGGAGLSGEAGS
ncbi:pentapeptide repeat-containing protein [Nonomuraea sp. PA05]|uniref:pentapeptide repeat-containing protein n=1 Tax=Nonomuraea sp. PA05 TaxID=2604466 RepID=UPI0011D86443|nr:pentapeptide repeat-containing protein [Nonomuraea sp. PA05]TYB71266.1 pentapeptide repeat-containing protein [Nonomuraea sp. PA05]